VLVINSVHTPASNLAVLDALQRDYSQIRIALRPEGAQFAGAINYGFEIASCDRVGLLLSDDQIAPETIERCLAHDADIVATSRCGMDVGFAEKLWENKSDPARFAKFSTIEQRASYIGHFMLFNRAKVLSIGGVDPNIGLTGADDYDMIWTLLEAGASVELIPEVMYFLRDHGGVRLTMRDQQSQIEDLRKILTKHGIVGEEAERMVEAKKKWYGTPGHVAKADPLWYLRGQNDNATSDDDQQQSRGHS
ncbi:MAG: glycosyltransferase, partial [Pirellula sp.]